jgi:hypothetical protein
MDINLTNEIKSNKNYYINKDILYIFIIFLIYIVIDYNLIVRVFQLDNKWNDFLKDIVPKEYIKDNKVEFNKIFGLLGWLSVSIGLYYFIYKSERINSIYDILFYSIIFTIVVYGTFDFTLLAIMPNYTYTLALYDMLNGLLSITLTISAIYILKNIELKFK